MADSAISNLLGKNVGAGLARVGLCLVWYFLWTRGHLNVGFDLTLSRDWTGAEGTNPI